MLPTWFETVYQYALIGIFAVSATTVVALVFINAPYGRHLRQGWGPTINSTAGWVIMETAAVASITAFFLLSDRTGDPVSVVFLCMWQAHYLYRTYIFPFRRKGGSKPMPLAIVGMAVTFNVWNGFLNGAWLFHYSPARDISWFTDPRFGIGLGIFVVGMFINHHSDAILLNLRAPGETGYKIPVGGLYRYVSMPNYLGELIEWVGWTVATWSLAGLSFAVFTAANLVPRAMANHRWYKTQFSDYPCDRKAVIPFIL